MPKNSEAPLKLWPGLCRMRRRGGAGLRVLNLGGETVDTKSATGKLILTIFAGFAQFERETMLERQREGIAKAKAENRYMGRRPSARLKADEAVKLFKAGRTVTQIAGALGIGRGSVYRALETCGIKQPASAASGSVKVPISDQLG